MNEVIFIVEEAPEGGYTARALDVSIVTEADTMDDLHAQVRDAVRCHFDDGKAPPVIRLHFVRDEVIATRGCRATCRATSSPRRWPASATPSRGRRAAISA